MADTEDVAKVLFEWMFNKKPDNNYGILENYEAPPECQGITDMELVEKLQYLSERYRIGIEDARQILRNSKEERS